MPLYYMVPFENDCEYNKFSSIEVSGLSKCVTFLKYWMINATTIEV